MMSRIPLCVCVCVGVAAKIETLPTSTLHSIPARVSWTTPSPSSPPPAATPRAPDRRRRGHRGGGRWRKCSSRAAPTPAASPPPSSSPTSSRIHIELHKAKSLTAKRKVELTNLLNTNIMRRRLPNTITIDSIHKKNFLSPMSVFEAVIVDVFVLPDDSEKVFAWCVGQTAVEFLQISPDEYMELPEDERAMYLFTLQNESFTVAIANTSKRVDGYTESDESPPAWEITRAQKCE